MKSIYLLLLALWAAGRLAAQNVTQVEYFIDDTDKGHGKNAVISVANGTADHTIPLTNVSPGFHKLYLRAKNADNTWGVTTSRAIFVEKQQRPVNITRLEYYYVGSSGTPSATYAYVLPTPAPAVDTTFAGVAQGLVVGQKYTLYLWAFNEAGERSLINTTTFTYSECVNVPKPKVSVLQGVVNVSGSLTLTCDQTGVAYQWLLNGTPVGGATKKDYTVKATDFGPNGASFAVRTTQPSGCAATSDPLVITATEEAAEAGGRFQVFPNPVLDQVTIRYAASQGAIAVRAYVFDATGKNTLRQALHRKAGNTWETSLFLAASAPGLYMIRLEDGFHSATKSFVKR